MSAPEGLAPEAARTAGSSHLFHPSPDAAGVAQASIWLRALCEQSGLSSNLVERADLCLSELLANIAEHVGAAAGAVCVRLDLIADGLQFRVEDHGPPFDPLAYETAARPHSLATARIGGLGIHLVRSFADETRHERANDGNHIHVVLRSRLSAPPDEPAQGRAVDRRGGDTPRAAHAGPERRSGRDRRVRDHLGALRVFEGVPPSVLTALLARCAVVDLPDGEILMQPGQRNDHVGFVIAGRLRVHLDSPDRPHDIEVPAGDCIGEMSVIDRHPVSAYVVSDGHCRLLLVPGDVFLRRLLSIPQLARNLMSLLAARMRRNNEILARRLAASLELQRLERELGVAREIQASMLPPGDRLLAAAPDLGCAGRMQPAREVGGDFYDAFFLDADHVLVAVGDVCGKGTPAALFMVKTLTLLRGEALQRPDGALPGIDGIVERVNDALFLGTEGRLFVTLFCAIYERSTGRLSYVNAGHEPPLVLEPEGRVGRLAEPRNLVCGARHGRRYHAGERVLPPGATLLLFTDGVSEARSPSGERFGEQRLGEVVLPAAAEGALAVVQALFTAIAGFGGDAGSDDDLTALALTRRPWREQTARAATGHA
jgi:serine phosphatase RsbU (regulator of sigma subunit)/anti-sigma regulatory factor (Ser/Thr protein kinase)